MLPGAESSGGDRFSAALCRRRCRSFGRRAGFVVQVEVGLRVRALVICLLGDHVAARDSYQAAAERTASLPKQRYLHARAARRTDDM